MKMTIYSIASMIFGFSCIIISLYGILKFRNMGSVRRQDLGEYLYTKGIGGIILLLVLGIYLVIRPYLV